MEIRISSSFLVIAEGAHTEGSDNVGFLEAVATIFAVHKHGESTNDEPTEMSTLQ